MTSVTTEDGSDDVAGVIVSTIKEHKEGLTKDAAHLWYQESFEWLQEAASRRAELGVQHGREGRAKTGLGTMLDNFIPPTWDDSEDAWIWSVDHEGAVFQEFGAKPHEIRAKKAEVLAFEWPDAPEEVKEQFEHTEGDLVFFESINHPGIPAIGFTRYGRDRAAAYLRQHGYEEEVLE